VVGLVLAEPERPDELIRCILADDDELVRMRASDALEKIGCTRPVLLQPHVSLLSGDMSRIDQPSLQWHVAQILSQVRLTPRQRSQAVRLLTENLPESTHWIVLNCSLETLAVLARQDPAVVDTLLGQLRRHDDSSFKSLANRARKLRSEFGPEIPTGAPLFRFLITLTVGAASFCALGFAITAMIPNADAAAPIVNATILPLLFLSGVFIPIGDNAPAWITWTARIFPVKHFADGIQAGFLGTTFHWSDVLIVGVWGLGALLFALRFFRWEPRT